MDQEVEAAEKAGRASKSEQYKKCGKVVVRGHGIETKGRTKGRIV